MRLKSLKELRRPPAREVELARLPCKLRIHRLALEKAFAFNRAVRRLFQESFEWYGFTLGRREEPEIVVDIGLPRNDDNFAEFTRVGAERIAAFQEALPGHLVINGWVHSHGSLDLQTFSVLDAANQAVVLDYVSTLVKRPVAKREVVIQDVALLTEEEEQTAHLSRGSVTLVTDVPVSRARLWETVLGGFCYALVVGDDGWHRQEVHYLRQGLLTGRREVSHREVELEILDSAPGEHLEEGALLEEVREKITPLRYRLEKLERV
jgi:hypothetical protein